MFPRYLPSAAFHIPVRSGLPSGVLVMGAVRFGLPFGKRGVLGNGMFTHWRRTIAIAVITKFMGSSGDRTIFLSVLQRAHA